MSATSGSKLDPKSKNLIKFLFPRLAIVGLLVYVVAFTNYIPGNSAEKVLFLIALVALVRILLSIYRRLVQSAKPINKYGRWCIVTGTTSGIGQTYAEYLAGKGMNLLIISRTENKLVQQKEELQKKYIGIKINYLVYDFTVISGDVKYKFYDDLNKECVKMDSDGGIAMLINNVGTANEIPMNLDELTEQQCLDIVNCNIFSTINMTRTVIKYMKERKNGAVISVSSGSGNHPGPFLAVYSATKAFITQFSRSLSIEWWGSGVDFLVVTPFYISGTQLYKKKGGTLLAPMPIELVKGTFKQLGKKYIWQGHGYWFHGFIGNFASYYWGTTARYRKMMVDNRKRYDERNKEAKRD